MACIGKISTSLAMTCGAPEPAEMGKIISAKVLNASDIESFTVISGVATITRLPTTRAYDLTVDNNAVTVSVGLKSQDIIPGAYDVEISFKNFSSGSGAFSVSVLGTVRDIGSSELVFAVEQGGMIKVYGLGAPLVCTEIAGDTTSGGYVTYTYGVEDWQVGTTIHSMSKADYDALSTPQAVPKSQD
nr:MAG: hypothetical protein [Bacteriophage sp.]